MRNIILLVSLLCLFIFNKGYAQTEIGEIWNCVTQVPIQSEMRSVSTYDISETDLSPKVLNVFFHILRRSDGTGGLSDSDVDHWVSKLYDDYLPLGIFIQETGRSFLNSSTFYSGITDSNFQSLMNADTHSNAIDVYILSPNDVYSRASNIPGVSLAIGGSYKGTSVLSHELGHCLGLYHTHSGRGCNDFANCAEDINGSNCFTCGDLICDTPADPCLSGNVSTNCVYIGDPNFHPDVHNIMSYAPPTCLERFSQGQIQRMHYFILNNSLLQARSKMITISGFSTVCSSGSNFSLNNLPENINETQILWDCSSNLSLQNGNTGKNKLISALSYGPGWIRASININGTILSIQQLNVQVGVTALFDGARTILYQQPQTYTAMTQCTVSRYEWWLRSDKQGVQSVLVEDSKSVILKSVPDETTISSTRQPSTKTYYYLQLNVYDVFGNKIIGDEEKITALGKVKLEVYSRYARDIDSLDDENAGEKIAKVTSLNKKIYIEMKKNSINQNIQYSFCLYDEQGVLKKQIRAVDENVVLDVNDLSAKIYFLYISLDDKNIESHKVVVR